MIAQRIIVRKEESPQPPVGTMFIRDVKNGPLSKKRTQTSLWIVSKTNPIWPGYVSKTNPNSAGDFFRNEPDADWRMFPKRTQSMVRTSIRGRTAKKVLDHRVIDLSPC
jgi:hypothetical protein